MILFFFYFLITSLSRIFGNSPKFLINVFLWNRFDSSKRLLMSLKNANYNKTEIDLVINFEHSADNKLLRYCNNFNWTFGKKLVKISKYHSGLEKMIINSWKPTSNNEYSFFFEDDIEVSKNFFIYTLKIFLAQKSFKNICGISLNTPKYDQINYETSIWRPTRLIKSNHKLFLFQNPNSWGALYFPWSWKKFQKYYSLRKSHFSQTNILPLSNSNSWDHSWKKYFIEFMVLNSLLQIYPLFSEESGYSVHHREIGAHIKSNIKRDYYTNRFVEDFESNLFLSNYNISKFSYPIFSIYHNLVTFEDLNEFRQLILSNLKVKNSNFYQKLKNII